MLDTSKIPNSITNKNSTSFNDEVAPYPYLTFITFFNYKDLNSLIHNYNQYIIEWDSIKTVDKSSKRFNDSTREKYFELLNTINLDYSTAEERRFLSNLNFNNALDRDLLIPFYVNKINDITNYIIDKRENIKFSIQRNKHSNSHLGINTQIKDFIVDELTQNNQYLDIDNYTLCALINDLEVAVLEKYDTFSHYYDIDPETEAKDYNVKSELFNKYFKNNTLDYDTISFIDKESYIISLIKDYAFFILDIGFGISFTTNADDIESLKPKDFINQTSGTSINDLNIQTYEALTKKYAGVDMYYMSAVGDNICVDKLYDAEMPYANILNKKHTSIQNIISEQFDDKRTAGAFFLPNTQSISFYNAYNKQYTINENVSGVYFYPDVSVCGNIYGASLTQLKAYPYSWQTNLNGIIYEPAYNKIAGKINSNKYQDFFGYNTQNRECNLTQGFESISNQGIITNYKVDIYGNEYAIFKQKQYNKPDSVSNETLLVSNITNVKYISGNNSNISDGSSDLDGISFDFDGGEFAQILDGVESFTTSDYREWPDLNGLYYYDILLEAGLHSGDVYIDGPYKGYLQRPYFRSTADIISSINISIDFPDINSDISNKDFSVDYVDGNIKITANILLDPNSRYIYTWMCNGDIISNSNTNVLVLPYSEYNNSNIDLYVILDNSLKYKPAEFINHVYTNEYYSYDGGELSAILPNNASPYYYTPNIPYISNKPYNYGTTFINSIIDSNQNSFSTIYEKRKLTGNTYIKYANTSECIPLSTVFNFIPNISELEILDIDIIHDVLIITHKKGLLFTKIFINSLGQISKTSQQIRFFDIKFDENGNKQNILSRYFYIEKDDCVMFVDLKLDQTQYSNYNGVASDVRAALIPTIYKVSLNQLNVSKIYDCDYLTNVTVDGKPSQRLGGANIYDYYKFGCDIFKDKDILNNIDTPIMAYNSLNDVFNVAYTIRYKGYTHIGNISFICRFSTAEVITCDLYSPISLSLIDEKSNTPLTNSITKTSANNIHLLETQMLDSDNNHIFCIFEDNDGKVYINILKQQANRVIAYQEKLITDSATIFVTEVNEEEINTASEDNYECVNTLPGVDTAIVMTTINNSDHLPLVNVKTKVYTNDEPLYIDTVISNSPSLSSL